MSKIERYHYVECGLDNVFVSGLTLEDDNGNECVVIPQVQQLHDFISVILLNKPTALIGKELYFIRGELGVNIPKLAEMTDISENVLRNWEKESTVDDAIDAQFKSYCLTEHYSDFMSAVEVPKKQNSGSVDIARVENSYQIQAA